MAGPLLQTPGPFTPVTQADGTLTSDYAVLLHQLQNIAYYSTRSGATANRPTSTSEARWIGMPYFDVSLGKTVYLKIASTNVWVDGSGAIV